MSQSSRPLAFRTEPFRYGLGKLHFFRRKKPNFSEHLLYIKYCPRHFYILTSLENKHILYTYFTYTLISLKQQCYLSIYYCPHFADEETFLGRIRSLLGQGH